MAVWHAGPEPPWAARVPRTAPYLGLEAAGAVVKEVHTPDLARAAGLPENPGFELLAIRPDARRAIEVKGRATTGDVAV